MHVCSLKPTNSLEDNMEERDDWSLHKGIQLVDKSVFDHLVSCDVHHPLVAPPQTEHWTILLRQLHRNLDKRNSLFSSCGPKLFSLLKCCSLLTALVKRLTSPSRLF